MSRAAWVLWGFAIVLVCGSIGSTPATGDAEPLPTDTDPPVGTILSPLPGSWVENYYYISFRVRFTDPDRVAVNSLALSLDGNPLQTGWNEPVLSAYTTTEALAEGVHTAEARASDVLGNGPTVLTWTFQVDLTSPVVNITNPIGNPLLTDGSLTLTWTGWDAVSGIDHYVVRLDPNQYTLGMPIDVGTSTSFSFPELAPGVHYFSVTAYDIAENAASAVAIATVPAGSPPPPPPPTSGNTTVRISLSGDMPSWATALIAINAVELVAIIALAMRRREPSGRRRSEGDR